MPVPISSSHPSLQIGRIVEPALLDLFKRLNNLQQQIDSAHDSLNSLILMKRSLTMTINELSDMQVDTAPITDKLKTINEAITTAAIQYMDIRIINESKMQEVRLDMQKTEPSANIESIIDFGASKYEARPFAAESLNLDSQFFSFGSNMEDSIVANIEKFVRDSTSAIPNSSDKMAQAVSAQLMNQVQNHSISGTLIIVASCQHRNIGIFNPLVINADKAVHAWNILHEKNPIDPLQAPSQMDNDSADSLSIITGATYGSSFVGMVHILQSDKTQIDDYETLKAEFENKISLNNWLANATGDLGVNEDAMKDIRSFISNKSINCHVSVITSGAITSLGANTTSKMVSTASAVKDKEVEKVMNVGHSANASLHSASKETTQRSLLANIGNLRIDRMMEKAQVLDEKANNTLNINSLMTAFTNYITAINTKDAIVGTPIGFSIKTLTKNDIIELLLRKFDSEKAAVSKPAETEGKAQAKARTK